MTVSDEIFNNQSSKLIFYISYYFHISELKKAKARLAEAQTGCYDFCALYAQVLANQRILDVADYVGPVKLVEIPGRGVCL